MRGSAQAASSQSRLMLKDWEILLLGSRSLHLHFKSRSLSTGLTSDHSALLVWTTLRKETLKSTHAMGFAHRMVSLRYLGTCRSKRSNSVSWSAQTYFLSGEVTFLFYAYAACAVFLGEWLVWLVEHRLLVCVVCFRVALLVWFTVCSEKTALLPVSFSGSVLPLVSNFHFGPPV